MTEETGGIAAEVKVTNETPDLEAGDKKENPLQALQKHSTKFHQEKVKPLLEKAGTSFKKVQETGAAKTREIGDSFRKASEASVAKSREIGAATVQKTRDLGLGTQLAAAATVAKTKNTLAQIGSEPTEKTETGETVIKGEQNDFWVTGWHSHSIQLIAIVGGVAALVTMVLIEGQLVDIASLATILLAPLVFWQKMQLNALGGMRKQQNALRASANRLTVENGKLSDANTQLEKQVDGLKDVETKLNSIAMKAGAQVDRLVLVVQENGELQKEIKEQLEDEVVQQVMTAVIKTDRDGNFTLDSREVYELEMRLDSLPAVHVQKKKFRDFIVAENAKDDLTLSDLSRIVHNLKDATIPDSERIIAFKPEEILKELPPPEKV